MKKTIVVVCFVLFVFSSLVLLYILSSNLSPQDNQALPEGAVLPEPNTKIAFIGDTGMGANFKKVLDLINAEEADAVVHLGDFDYTDNPQGFVSVIDEKLGETYPYLVVAGNHDRSMWEPNCNSGKGCYSEIFAQRYITSGIPVTLEMLLSDKYHVDFQGIQFLFIGPGRVDQGPEYAQFLDTTMSQSDNLWKICNWHFNQEKLQLGGKIDQTGWEVYDTCLDAGAIIATAHEHSYQRTRSIINFHTEEYPKVNPLYQDPNDIYVYPGSTFVFVSGLGGKSIRNQDRCLPSEFPYGCNQEWAKVYTSNQQAKFGALFVEFNYDGDPTKARGYFKNIEDVIIDSFEITLKTNEAQQTTTPVPSSELSPSPTNIFVPSVSPSDIISTPVITPTQLQPSSTTSPTIIPTPSELSGNTCGKSDIDDDGRFSIADFAEFAKSYGIGGNTCADKDVDYGSCGGRDVNRDGKLNIADFGAPGIGFAQRYYPKASCAI